MEKVNQKYVAKVVAEMSDHRYLYLIQMPRKYATTVVMARDTARSVGNVIIGMTVSGREVGVFSQQFDHPGWESSYNDPDCDEPHTPIHVEWDACFVVVGLEKPAAESVWMTSEEFVGLAIVPVGQKQMESKNEKM